MPTLRRQPVVVEVRPDDANYNMAPSSPPKTVRFPDQKELVTGVTRPLTPDEAWSLYYFEVHARDCSLCRSAGSGRLCDTGYDLAQNVKEHVHWRQGQVYSTKIEGSREIRVEVPHGYDRLLGLLMGMSKRAHKPRPAPIISYDLKYPRARKSPGVRPIIEEDADAYSPTYIVPAHSERRSRHKRYTTIVVNDEGTYDKSDFASLDSRRGSLYKENVRPRVPKEYRIEVLEPEDHQHRRRKNKTYHG